MDSWTDRQMDGGMDVTDGYWTDRQMDEGVDIPDGFLDG
jgi:hypothetical protein